MARQKTLTAPTNFSTLPPGTKARITDDYALYAGQTCTIAARPSHDAAIVELESGARERIPIKFLREIPSQPCNTKSSASFQGSAPYVAVGSSKQDSKTDLESCSLSSKTPTDKKSLNGTTPTLKSTQTLQPTLQISSQMSLLADFPVGERVALETERDYLTSTLAFGLKCFGLSTKPVQLLWSLRTWRGLLIAVFEQFVEDSVWSDTVTTIRRSYQPPKSALPTCENECLLLPTPMACLQKKGDTRPPGGDKLERMLRLLPTPTATDIKGKRQSKLRQGGNDLETQLQPLIPNLHVSHPAVREYMMGLETGYTDITAVDGGLPTVPPAPSASPNAASPIEPPELPPSEIVVRPSKLPSSGGELDTSPLSYDEERDRHHLERKVDVAQYEGWSALWELRERRLYRNTHKTWEEYCKDRFGFGRDSADLKVLAAQVVDNLKKLPTNGRQILPTSERQIRPIAKAQLSDDEQRQVWQEAVEEADGKVPTGRIVKGIVERLKEKPLNLASSYCSVGEIFKLQRLSGKESKYNGCWSIALEVENRFTVKCRVYDAILDIKQENIKRMDMTEEELAIQRQVIERVSRLARCNLDPAAWALLEVLNRQVHYTDFQMKLLETAEQFYGVKSHEN